MKRWGRRIFLWLFLLLLLQHAPAQTCVDDYFTINYETSTVQNPVSSILTSENDLLLAGTVMRYRSVLLNGWITKFSKQGTILWSKQYTSGDFNYVQFNKAVQTATGDYLVTGNIGNVDTTKVPPAPYTQLGFLAKMDKYGTLLWSKVFAKTYVSNLMTDIKNIIRTRDNDFIVSVNYSASLNSCNVILRIDDEGNVKWSTTLQLIDPPARYSSIQVTQLRNNDIAAACYITVADANNPFAVTKQGYCVVGLDYDSGLPEWKRLFNNVVPSTREKSFSEIIQITELPNSDLSFIASYADTAYIYFRKSTKVINIITDNIGRLKKIMAYANPTPPIFASSAASVGNNGDQVMVMDNSDAPYLMCINAAGDLNWQKSYPLVGRSQETRSLLATSYGYYFFSFTHNGGSTDLKLVKTDINGGVECANAELAIRVSDITTAFKQEDIALDGVQVPAGYFYATPYIFTVGYPMTGTITCRKACCTEIIDTVAKIDLCNVESFTLPNKDVIKQPGTYGIPYTASTGCDSIVYYPIFFSKKPDVDLGRDECLAGKDSILLKTTAGYAAYNWMGTSTTNFTYTAKQPGKYWVSVENSCGKKTDTIEIFRECDFPIYMPNAFTPNNDTHNDYFRVPRLNNNRLLKLMVYNRWGQVVFQTSTIESGWDGTYKNQLQPEGIYIYYLLMETLGGKQVTQKGVFTLTR